MVHFIVYEDVLQYKAKINRIISELKDINYQIYDETNSLNIKKRDTYIFIIDLEKENSIEYMENINKNFDTDFYILVLTSHMNLSYYLFKRKLLIFDMLSKFENFEERLKTDIDFIIKKTNKEKVNISDSNIEIPKEEIEQITFLKDKIVIKGKNIKNEEYTYVIDGKFNNIKRDIEKYFVCNNNEYTLYFKRNEFHIKVSLKMSKSNNYVRPYKKEDKEKIITLYNKGYRVSELSKIYSISKTTIYNWINKSKISIKIKKYEEIEKIVNG